MKREKIVIYDSFKEDELDEDGLGYNAEFEHEDAMAVLQKIVNESDYGVVLDGTVQTWQGRFRGGGYAETWDDLCNLIAGYYIRISQIGKRIFLDLVHHDGTNGFELKRVTKKGYKVVDNNPYRHKTEHAQALSRAKCYTKSAGGWPEL